MVQVVGPIVFAGAVLAALFAGPVVLGIVVVCSAGLALVDTTLLFGRSGARPILPVAAIPAVALPAVVAFDSDVTGLGWERVSAAFAIAVVAAFTLALVFGRRRGVVDAVGTTFAAGLLIGLGATCLVLLRELPSGLEWVLTIAVLAVIAEVTGPAVALVAAHRDAEVGAAPVTLVPLIAVALAAVALYFLIGDPLEPWITALIAIAAAVAALGGDHLRRVLADEGGVSDNPGLIGTGGVLASVDGLLLSAPVVYVLARAAVL